MSLIAPRAVLEDPELLGGRIPWRPEQLDLAATVAPGLNLWLVSRQGGKSSLAAALGVWDAGFRPECDEMMPRGEWRTTPIVSPSEDQCRALAQKVGAFAESVPLLAPYVTVMGDRVNFEIPRTDAAGRRYIAKSRTLALAANSKSMRGYTGSLCVVEEACQLDESAGPGGDRRIIEAITPTLTRFGDKGVMLAISSAWSESGWFWETLQQVEAGEIPNSRAVTMTIEEIWPAVDHDWLEGQRRQLGLSAFRREYYCEPSSGVGSFFPDLDSYHFEDGPAPPEAGKEWLACWDPAWASDGFGWALIAESVETPGTLVAGPMGAIKPGERQRSFAGKRRREDQTLTAAWRAVEAYEPTRVVSDQANADAIKHFCERQGAQCKIVNLTGPIQAQAFTALRARLDDQTLALWRCPELLDELRRVSVKGPEKLHLARSGDSHVDIGSALALGAYELRHLMGVAQESPRAGGRGIMAGILTPKAMPREVASGLRAGLRADPDREGQFLGTPRGLPREW